MASQADTDFNIYHCEYNKSHEYRYIIDKMLRNVRINVTLRRVRLTIIAVEKQ